MTPTQQAPGIRTNLQQLELSAPRRDRDPQLRRRLEMEEAEAEYAELE